MDVEAPGWKPKVKIDQALGQARELNTRCAPLDFAKPSCFMIRFAILAAVLPATLLAAPGPLSPTEALAAFQGEPGVRVEIAAAEPLVRDPVALCFGDAGRMFVVEGRSYPQLGESPLTLGTVALLEDADGDGRFEKRTTFADGFTFPNGIMSWDGGVFLTCAPDIWFLKDTTGDGRADVRQVVLTGFGTKSSSEQLRVASPTLGPDGWVYITSGLTDAKVTSPLHPKRPAVTAKRQDGRFHPETFVYEPLAGVGQFGQCFDALGHRFVSSNRNPLMHVVLSPGILKRNPHFAFTETVENVVPVAAKVYPISPDTTAATYIPSLINQQHTGTYTSASGICIRGGSAFICEPAQNLVQRQRLRPSGATFLAEHPTPGRDFLASADQWFRPVHAIVGPDGALYVCDMVRQYIDHPRYLPEPIRGKLPFRAGTDKGRIWRVVQMGVAAEKQTAEAKAAALKTLQLSQGNLAMRRRWPSSSGSPTPPMRASGFRSHCNLAKCRMPKKSSRSPRCCRLEPMTNGLVPPCSARWVTGPSSCLTSWQTNAWPSGKAWPRRWLRLAKSSQKHGHHRKPAALSPGTWLRDPVGAGLSKRRCSAASSTAQAQALQTSSQGSPRRAQTLV